MNKYESKVRYFYDCYCTLCKNKFYSNPKIDFNIHTTLRELFKLGFEISINSVKLFVDTPNFKEFCKYNRGDILFKYNGNILYKIVRKFSNRGECRELLPELEVF